MQYRDVEQAVRYWRISLFDMVRTFIVDVGDAGGNGLWCGSRSSVGAREPISDGRNQHAYRNDEGAGRPLP